MILVFESGQTVWSASW